MMEPVELLVDPGGQVSSTVMVRNLGTRVEEFELLVQGPGAVFGSLTPDAVSVYPDLEQPVVVRFTPPRSPQSLAGVSTFEVLARSVVHSDVRDVARGRLTITPFEDLQATLVPEVSRGRRPARHQLTVTNAGNTPVSAQVDFADQDKVLSFDPQRRALALEPGAIQNVPVLLNGPHRWFGRTERLPFSALVTPTGAQPPITLPGTRQQTAVFPWWAPPAALAIIALLIGLVALLKPGPPTVPVIGPIPEAIAVKQLTDAGYLPDEIRLGDNTIAAGLATKTNPAGGTPLKRGEHVNLYVSTGPCPGPCPVEVPDVEGLLVSDARTKLANLKFTVRTDQMPSDRPAGQVISSTPVATTQRPSGSEVVLTVSSGPMTGSAAPATTNPPLPAMEMPATQMPAMQMPAMQPATQMPATQPATQMPAMPIPATTTTTALSTSPVSPVAPGTNVTLTATVTPATAPGTVQFKDGTTTIGNPVIVSSGTAAGVTSQLPVGPHQLNAVFTPADPTLFTASMSPTVTFQVTQPPKQTTDTRTTLTTTPSTSAVAGSAVTLIATVTPATAAGTVQFKDGTMIIGTPATVNQGTASTTTLLSAGSRQLIAVYSPADPTTFNASTSPPVSLTVVESSQAVTTPAQQSGQSLDGSTVSTPAPTDLDSQGLGGQGVTVLDLGGLTVGQPNDGSGLTLLGGPRPTILRSGGGGLLSNLLRDLL